MAAILSVVLGALLLSHWQASYRRSCAINLSCGRYLLSIYTFYGKCSLHFQREVEAPHHYSCSVNEPRDARDDDPTSWYQPEMHDVFYSKAPFFGIAVNDGLTRGDASVLLLMALWMPVVLLWLPFPFLILGAYRHIRRARNTNLCSCGYDLRASPIRCPECGLERNRPLSASIAIECWSVIFAGAVLSATAALGLLAAYDWYPFAEIRDLWFWGGMVLLVSVLLSGMWRLVVLWKAPKRRRRMEASALILLVCCALWLVNDRKETLTNLGLRWQIWQQGPERLHADAADLMALVDWGIESDPPNYYAIVDIQNAPPSLRAFHPRAIVISSRKVVLIQDQDSRTGLVISAGPLPDRVILGDGIYRLSRSEGECTSDSYVNLAELRALHIPHTEP